MPIESRSPIAYGRYPALSRRHLGVFSYVSELYAGERLRLAGYSSGTGVCARGGCSAGRCGSLGMSCTRSRRSLRFSRGVLCSITPAVCRVSAKQDGLRYVAFLFRRGSRSLVVRSRIVGTVIEDGWFNLGLSVSLWRSRRKTKERGERGTESAAKRKSAFA